MSQDDYITEQHAAQVCLIGKSTKTCRFITMSQLGWSCEKNTIIGKFLNMRAERMAQINRGINCEGRLPRHKGSIGEKK